MSEDPTVESIRRAREGMAGVIAATLVDMAGRGVLSLPPTTDPQGVAREIVDHLSAGVLVQMRVGMTGGRDATTPEDRP